MVQPYHIQNEAIAYHLEEQSLGHRLATEIDDASAHPKKSEGRRRKGS